MNEAAANQAETAEAAMTGAELLEGVERVGQFYGRMKDEIAKAIVGQEAVIDQVLVALLARGHCLLLGVPGLAKTLLVRSLGQVMDLSYNRIQFTPDLMPSDITGAEILEEEAGTGKRLMRFVKGPIFTNLLLADEINRTPPKTQAALLEAMQEYHVTSGGEQFPLPLPFFVLATQNPIEQEGTYPLPEAQLDRFMFLTRIDYPGRGDEIDILKRTTTNLEPVLEPVVSGEEILDMQRTVRALPISEHVITYCADLARASRPEDPDASDFIKSHLSWGAGPRAGQYLVLAAKAWAALHGRANICCEDVKRSAQAVFFHRLSCNFHAASEGVDNAAVIDHLLTSVPEPDSP